jgi:predicted DNA-binding protein
MVHILIMKPIKTMSIRLTPEQAEALEIVASVESLPLSEVIRTAIDEHIGNKTKDPVFQDSLKGRLERAQRLLKKVD